MGIPQEEAYNDGFVDGQLNVIEIWDDAIENTEGRTEAFEMFQRNIESLRKEIESL